MSATPLSFSALKRSRGASIESITQAIQQATQNKKEDERYWEATVDKADNGHAVIRFLPNPPQDGEDGMPWVRTFSHGFKGPGGWLIELCPTTIEQKCPVCEGNNVLWNTGIESNQKIVRDRKRKLSYTANILVISDPAKPENNGKVKLFKFGKKIFDKVYEKMHPEFPGEVAFRPYDMWEGANFKLRIRKVDGYRNYDKSEFDTQSAVGDDAKIEVIWKQEYSLREVADPTNFKTYAQIEARRAKVLGQASSTTTVESAGAAYDDEDAGVKKAPQANDPVIPVVAGEEDELNFFKSLAEE